jgi:eukaryotic-like serine/threonine-protein kinase
MTHLREHWEGVCLSGDYTLEQWLGGDDSAAFFQTSLAPDGRRVVVKLVPEAGVEGAAPLDLWQRSRQLRHPNLIEVLDCGRADHRGQIVLYAVFEAPDDTLASALSRSPLNREEAREVLDSVLAGLRYLHAQGLVLGALDADHIVAVGDRIKLSTGALRYAGTASAYREDVRLLGDLWQQALLPASPRGREIAAHAADPDPEARWTLAEITAALDPPLTSAPPTASPVTVPPPLISVPPLTAVNEEPAQPPSHRPSKRPTRERATDYRFPKWIFVGAAGVLLLIAGLNLRRPAGLPAQSPVDSVSLPAERPVPAPFPKAAAPRVVVPTIPVPTIPRPAPAAGKEMWRVIAFTYRSRDAAAKKVQQLNQQHPDLNATVFAPKDKRGYYLVSLGGRRTHEAALRLQRSARGKGLPRDLYVQNYSE